jgi:hypothetical protein
VCFALEMRSDVTDESTTPRTILLAPAQQAVNYTASLRLRLSSVSSKAKRLPLAPATHAVRRGGVHGILDPSKSNFDYRNSRVSKS